MLGMPESSPSSARSGRGVFRPRHWARAKTENPLARFVPFSSLVSPTVAAPSPPSTAAALKRLQQQDALRPILQRWQ